jgi:hypothetical protein
MIKAVAALVGLVCLTGQASAAQKAAVLPFEIIFQVREEDFFGAPREANDEEKQRLADAAAQLKQLMRDSGRYEPIDVASVEPELPQLSPLYKCQCEADLGKKLGADVVVTGIFDKASESLTNVTVREIDVASGKVRSMKAVMQGNTDVAWQNVIKWIAKNRMLKIEAEAAP